LLLACAITVAWLLLPNAAAGAARDMPDQASGGHRRSQRVQETSQRVLSMQQQQQQQLLPPQSQLNCQHTGACSCAAGSSQPQVLGADQLEGSQLPWNQPSLPLQEERAVPVRVRKLITEITSSLASGDRSVERADIVDSHQLEDSAGRALVSAMASTGPVRKCVCHAPASQHPTSPRQ
jgi:hypothetical protein